MLIIQAVNQLVFCFQRMVVSVNSRVLVVALIHANEGLINRLISIPLLGVILHQLQGTCLCEC